MTGADAIPDQGGPLLLCFDGSSDAAAAISRPADLFAQRSAVVLSVCQPIKTWVGYGPRPS